MKRRSSGPGPAKPCLPWTRVHRVPLLALAALSIVACRARAPQPSAITTIALTPADRVDEPIKDVPDHLIIGLTPVFAPEEMVKSYRPLADYLSDKLGTSVELELAENYDAMIQRVVSGDIDLVQLAPLAYVLAKQKAPSLELLLTNISEGAPMYSGFILARSESRIRSIEDLRGKRFGFVDKESTSGYLYPYAFFLDHEIDPEHYFKEIVMTVRHDRAVQALVAKQVDAVATFSGALLNAEANGVDTSSIEIVAKTGRIPYDAWCVRAELSPSVKRGIEHALLSLSARTAEGRRILDPLHSINGFAREKDSTYDEIRRVKKLVDQATD